MALSASTIWEVQTGGSDTTNGGAFDPSQTAGMFTDGAATSANTSAPVFTSASYNFVAGDVGAWLYVASGTNWLAGWYKIASVAANAATLTATAGLAVLKTSAGNAVGTLSTATGCATTASPTGATWTIDYSQQASAQFTYTDLASAGAGLTVSSAAKPFAKQHVGNCIVITGGTNFTQGRYVIASVAAGVATVVGPGNITSGAGASGTGGLGGAFASPGACAGLAQSQNSIWMQSGTYSLTSSSSNVAGGRVSLAARNTLRGYQTTRCDDAARPLLQASGISSVSIVTAANISGLVWCIEVDGANLTGMRGIECTTNLGTVYKCKVSNCKNGGIVTGSGDCSVILCYVTGCSTASYGFSLRGRAFGCVAYNNSVAGFGATADATAMNCISYGNTTSSGHGFADIRIMHCYNCTAYGNAGSGYYEPNGVIDRSKLVNCIAYGQTRYGTEMTISTDNRPALFVNCAWGNNTLGVHSNDPMIDLNAVTLTANPFTNAASGDFSLNNTAGGGSALRAAGIPSAFPTIGTTGYIDIGAAQGQAGGGGGISRARLQGGY